MQREFKNLINTIKVVENGQYDYTIVELSIYHVSDLVGNNKIQCHVAWHSRKWLKWETKTINVFETTDFDNYMDLCLDLVKKYCKDINNKVI